METRCSLPHPQDPATCPYPQPAQSGPCPPSHVLKIHFNVIPSTPGSPKWSPSLRSPHQNAVCTSLFPRTCYLSRPSHCSRFDYPNNIWWWVQVLYYIQILNVIGGDTEVWCVPSATHVKCTHPSQNEVLGISLLPHFLKLRCTQFRYVSLNLSTNTRNS
jgi:hypothetical protein